MKINAEEAVLKRLGLDYEILDSGCCGMAGSFGFESDKYDVSVACGERVLLPAVRRANKDTLVIADGFSCREQIQQHNLHLAEVIRLAMEKGSRGPEGNYPERDYAEEVKKISSLEVVGFTALAMLAVGVVIPALFRNGRHWR